MPSIADAVAQLEAADLPVLFADTCILVDVIRAPRRPAELAGCVEAACELLDLVIAPAVRCSLVVASFVPGEWLEHAAREADNLRVLLSQIDHRTDGLHRFCGLVGIIPPFPVAAYRGLALAETLHDFSDRLLNSALHLDPDHDCILRSHARASSYTPPARKGQVRDATFIEECLEVSRRLQSAGFARRRVFCTSNTNDYCERGPTRLHPSLAVDFGAAGLEFATNLPWAVNEIKKP
jgi:hypothetical protein